MASSRAARQSTDNDSSLSNQESLPHSASSQEDAHPISFRRPISSSREALLKPSSIGAKKDLPDASGRALGEQAEGRPDKYQSLQSDDEAESLELNTADEDPISSAVPERSKGKGRAARSPFNAIKNGLSRLNFLDNRLNPTVRWTIPFELNKEAVKVSGNKHAYHGTLKERISSKGRDEITKILCAYPPGTEVYVNFRLRAPFEGRTIDDAAQCFTILNQADACLHPEFDVEMLYKHGFDAKALEAEQRQVKAWLADIAKEQGCNTAALRRDLAR